MTRARRKIKAEHVVVGPSPHVATCLRCGAVLDLMLPMPINQATSAMLRFIRAHAACQSAQVPA